MTAKVSASILFLIMFSLGILLSLHKPLWNDEIYTQVGNIEKLTYQDILLVRIKEGNVCPLFYLLQKGLMDLVHYKFPRKWNNEWSMSDVRSQVITRLLPNIFMSLSLALIFYYFTKAYSWGWGFYSLLVSLSTTMVWAHWAETRHYALWFFLTTLQSLLFLSLLQKEQKESFNRKALEVTHLLLSLTIVFSVVQIVIVSFIWWLLRENNLQKFLVLTVIPCLIAFFYYVKATKYKFIFSETPWQLLMANISADRFLFILIYSLVVFAYRGKIREQGYLALVSSSVLASIVILFNFKWRGPLPGEPAFSVASRYLIFLSPLGIIATTLFSVNLMKFFKNNTWMRWNLLFLFSALMIWRVLKMYSELTALGIYS